MRSASRKTEGPRDAWCEKPVDVSIFVVVTVRRDFGGPCKIAVGKKAMAESLS